MILDDLMAWIILQVHGENATADSTMQTPLVLPLASP